MSIEQNLTAIRETIAVSAKKSGRRPEDITLAAVTKTVSPENILRALDCGIEVIGENRAQELLSKAEALKDRCKIHFIGHLQTNKISSIIDHVDMIESLDSQHLAEQLNRQAANRGRVVEVLVQVNTGAEPNKSGFLFGEVEGFLDRAQAFPNLKICGLMAVLPIETGEKQKSCEYFQKMHHLFVDIKAKKKDNIIMDYLSMGMSNDYALAIEHGANLVRIGAGIFGHRK